mmetsp:Transcript_35390/g.90940  ORF Transcript_35390/g.90940 Transcript_35390/m.90940 type:complete len:129 (+) Transcript_35390:209-595(+)
MKGKITAQIHSSAKLSVVENVTWDQQSPSSTGYLKKPKPFQDSSMYGHSRVTVRTNTVYEKWVKKRQESSATGTCPVPVPRELWQWVSLEKKMTPQVMANVLISRNMRTRVAVLGVAAKEHTASVRKV